MVEETCENEDSRENMHPIVDSVEEESSEGAADLEAKPMEHRPKRKLKPVSKLSYDELGQPSERPITVVHRVHNSYSSDRFLKD